MTQSLSDKNYSGPALLERIEELERRVRNVELETHSWVATAGHLVAQHASLGQVLRQLEQRVAQLLPEPKRRLWRRKGG